MNLVLLIGSTLVVTAVFTSLISFRFGAPLLLVFLLVGLAAGEDGLGITFNNTPAAYFIGSIALAIILFDSGFETRVATLRIAALPAATLATVGVIVTAAVIALLAMAVFNISFLHGLLFGAIVAPTDAAAVFFLLRVGGITLRDRVRSTLEVESGSNDPVAIFLTITLVQFLGAAQSEHGLVLDLIGEFLQQLGLGGLVGLVGGAAIVTIVNRAKLEQALYPIVVVALALLTYAVAGMMDGSGFLAVYVAGLIAGNAGMRHSVALSRFQGGMTWLSQIAMFLTLGLLATPSQFPAVFLPAMAIAAFLIVVARPVAVWLCLLPFRFSRQEMAFVSWVGLRGATSILLAILPIISGLPLARELFNVTFMVVLVSLLLQGWTIGIVARFLGIRVPARIGPVDRIELELPGRGEHEIVAYVVHPDSAVAKGQRIPRWSRPSLLVRDGRSVRPDVAGRPQAGDQVYVITTPHYIPLLDRLFAGPAEGTDDPRLYGEFALPPDTDLAAVAEAYGFPLRPGDAGMTLAALFRRTIQGNVERGDRIPYGPVDFIVRQTDDEHQILEVGLALEHDLRKQAYIPLFQTPGEMAAIMKRWVGRKPASAGSAGAVPAEADALPAEGAAPAEDATVAKAAMTDAPDAPAGATAAASEEEDRRDMPAA